MARRCLVLPGPTVGLDPRPAFPVPRVVLGIHQLRHAPTARACVQWGVGVQRVPRQLIVQVRAAQVSPAPLASPPLTLGTRSSAPGGRTYAERGDGICSPCPAGRYGNFSGMVSSACVGECAAGKYCPGSSIQELAYVCLTLALARYRERGCEPQLLTASHAVHMQPRPCGLVSARPMRRAPDVFFFADAPPAGIAPCQVHRSARFAR